MSNDKPDLLVPPPAPNAGRPAVHVPAPTQAARAAQHVPAPTQQPAARGHAPSQARQPGPQHVPAPAQQPPHPRAAGAGARVGAPGAQPPNMVTQTRGQQRNPGTPHVPRQDARSSPGARQGQRVPDQNAHGRPVQQVPMQQPPPPPSPHAGVGPARVAPGIVAPAPPPPPPVAAAPAPAPGSFDEAPKIPATSAEFVSRYRDQARILRKRATRPGLSPEHVADNHRRADWYEKRAAVKEVDGFMPRELRTPVEGVEGIDWFRRSLVQLLDGLGDLDGPEAGILAGAVHNADGATITRAAQLFNTWKAGSEMLAALLGVERGEFNPEAPTAERWKFKAPTLTQIDAAARIVDAKGMEEHGEVATHADENITRNGSSSVDASAVVQTHTAEGTSGTAAVVSIADVEGKASPETPIVTPLSTPEAPPPAATPEAEPKP
jgi:hypothetical protein